MNWEAASQIYQLIAQDSELADIYDPGGESTIEYLSREFLCLFSTPEVRHWWHDSGKVGFHHDFIRKTDLHIDST